MDEKEMETFIAYVRTMRKAQKIYFRTHDYNAMLDCKQYEGIVDKWIKNFDDRKVPDLFQGEELPF